MNRVRALYCIILFSAVEGAARADLRVKATLTAGGQNSDYTVYLKQDRQRFEYASGPILIRQMDTKRLIDIDDAAKSYVVLPLEGAAATPRKGGVVTVRTEVADTGERKEIFGHEARHLKTTVVTTSGPGACEERKERVETDGWYIDYNFPTPQQAASPGCQDEYRFEQAGEGKPGYPVSYVTKTTVGSGVEQTISMQVTELVEGPLDAALFEPPAGYTEAANVEAMAGARPKTAGVLRVGIAPLTDHSGHNLAVAPLRSRLLAKLITPDLQAVALDDPQTPGQCDYILYSDVTQMSKSVAGQITGKVAKLGGMLSRKSAAPAQDGSEATVSFRLVKTGATEPVLSSSAIGKNGSGLNLMTMVQIASFVTPMGLMMRGAGGQGMGMLASQLLHTPGMAGGDPGLGGLGMLMRGVSMAESTQAGSGPELAAVTAALELEAQAVSADLKKPERRER